MKPILNKTELFALISATLTKSKVTELSGILNDTLFDIKHLIELTSIPEKDIAFRAAWMLESLLMLEPQRFVNNLEFLLEQFLTIKNRSCQRHYAKIVVYLTSARIDKRLKAQFDTIDPEPVIARSFDLIIDPETPIAVSVHCSQALFNMRLRHDWIAEALTEQIKLMMDGGKPAIRARGRKLLNGLKVK